MNFETQKEIFDFIEKNTEFTIIQKLELASFHKDGKYFIHTEKGIKYLQEHGFFNRKYIKDKIGTAFFNWDCKRCPLDENFCKRCNMIKNIINSL